MAAARRLGLGEDGLPLVLMPSEVGWERSFWASGLAVPIKKQHTGLYVSLGRLKNADMLFTKLCIFFISPSVMVF